MKLIRQIVVVAIVILTLVPAQIIAQADGWTEPYKLSSTRPKNWFPSLTVDPWGAVHAVWSTDMGEREGDPDLLMYQRLTDGEWSPSNDIVHPGYMGYVARSALATDRSGRIHLLVRNSANVFYTSAYAADAWSASGWAPLRIMNNLGMPYYPAIKIDEQDRIHVTWQEASQTCQGCSDVWYRRSADNGATWTAPVNLSNAEYGSVKPNIVLGRDGAIFITWDEANDPNSVVPRPEKGIAFVASYDGGATWQPPQFTTGDSDPYQLATLDVDGNGTLIMVFRTAVANTLLYRRSSDAGETWSDPEAVPGLIARDSRDTPWDKYALAADSAGNLHLIAVGRRSLDDEVPSLFHLTWNSAGQNWSTPEVVVENELFPEWPQLTVGAGNRLHIVWFTRRASDRYTPDDANYDVWYSARELDTPRTDVAILPTPVPQPTTMPAVDAAAVPTAAAGLNQQQVLAPAPLSVRDETPILRLLGLAILAPLALLGVLVFAALLRRR